MKKLVACFICISLFLGLCMIPVSAAESTVYVASTGSDSNAGTENAPLLTLAAAFSKNPDKIVLLDNTTYTQPPAFAKNITITGKTASVQLSFADGSSFAGPTTLDNLTITSSSAQVALHCKGHPLMVTDSVTCSDTRIALFGGKNGSAHTGDTHLNIYGGSYNYIYGGNRGTATFTGNAYINVGGNANATDIYANDSKNSLKCEIYGGGQGAFQGNSYVNVTAGAYDLIYGGNKSTTATFTGDTFVTVGGTVNIGESIDDAATNISRLMIYGGGTGPVVGSTHVTLEGDAVCKYVVGAGSGAESTVSNSTNVYIKGGKAMNVYAGAKTAPLTCNTNLTMTGGIAEALFGGSEGTSMTGTATVTVLGGEVYRRIYTGCYNDWPKSILNWTYSTDHYVTGNTFLIIGPDAKILNKSALSSDNQSNMGIFCGSRNNAKTEEINHLIFVNGASSAHSGNVGDKSGYASYLKSCQDYTVTAIGGGMIEGTGTATISVKPDAGYAGFVGNTDYSNKTYNLSASSTAVDFKKTFKIEEVSANENGIEVNFWAENALNCNSPRLLCALYETDGTLADIQQMIPETTSTTHTFAYSENLQSGKTYIVKAFMWTDHATPQLEINDITFIK